MATSNSSKKQNSKPKTSQAKQVPLIIYILLSGVFGFMGGWFAIQNDSSEITNVNTNSGQQIVLSENDAIAKIAERVGPSVVSINVLSNEVQNSFFFGNQVFESESEGTGIILSEDGLVVTNKHVIPENATEVSVVLSDGHEYEDVEIIGRDPFNDIAFLRISGAKDLIPAVLGDSSGTRVGDKAIAIGNALGQFDNTVTAGIISGIGRPLVAQDGIAAEQLQNLFQTDTAINPGNSGGPLVNINGEVIGINTAVAGGAENIGFAIPINDVKPSIISVQDNGELIRPYLGVRYVALTDDIAKDLDLPLTRGALITAGVGQAAIIVDSPADKADLRDGDVITKVFDVEIDEKNTLVTTVSKYQVGETVTLTVLRDDEELQIDVTLEAAPENL